ncbi:NTF2-like N-terminal transpeptidase domain-containing protein [Saccharopolyspora kobensis]|uniref:NTF2-like N-terminal transpeptidase domain-containing protein n=2 Tax=Saccharopolyspora kobensis TaxID=146035 RepID=A0A1H6BSR3_9PSEU|nr:NTF2-like N-terminal transpeptidase domain-containing protein [Saccharopolyspora kobensis]SFC14577.1 NTF2-like N-terminal transpeptidase domain-containing protein [Saccharopolyspora kobensis]
MEDSACFGILADMVSKRIFAGIAALLLVPLAACSTGPSEQDVATAFVNAVAAGDAAGAAAQSDNPEQTRQAVEAARRSTSPEAVHATVREVADDQQGTPTAKFDLAWDFGEGKVWEYPSELKLVEGEQGWKVRWAPSVLHPKLQPGQNLAFREELPDPAPVLDRDGAEMMRPEQLVTVSLSAQEAGDVPKVAGALAGALGTIEPAITQQSIMDGVGRTPAGQPYAVVTLRQGDYERVRSQIYDLPGVRFPAQTRLVAGERGYGSQVLAGVARKADEQVAANAGWRVVAVDAAGNEAAELHSVAERPVEPMTVTLGDRTQRAAEQAVDQIPQASMLVAVQPSSGEVLAVAQNSAADAQGPVALSGQYPPGSTFKTVTATAGLEAGKVDANTVVECPAKKTFDGRVLPNDKEFELGRVPLHTAFARSCNTTFAQLAVDLPASALTDSAHRLGLGVDFDMPGATTITGKVPPADTVVQRAENGIGQGTVLASPFGMALVTASIAEGRMPVPTLIRGLPTKADAAPQPPSPQSLDQLRQMMREVVTGGTATGLAGSGEVRGKTGTAQFGDGTRSHGWFVGYRDDVAFAVLVTDAGSSGPAVDAARRFLSAS